jgi:anti-sigma B factor antagonist
MKPLSPQNTSHPSNRLTLECTVDGGQVQLKLVGEVDLETVPFLDQELLRITAAEPERLLLDLSGVEFIDSTGLSAIVRAEQSAVTGGLELSLRGGSRQVRRLFELTGLLERLNFEE